ncbi:PseG/SpsG family protein [Plantactinospora siamensis]|uniref:PseG/SpsG family protein n=1 Tax=Plantactinospora siamensis TaxID=555372 RepID=A0ABV6P4S8_9ACTN
MIRIGIRCDAGPVTGVGHLMRCLALADELAARGAAVHLLADVGGLPWAVDRIGAHDLEWGPAPAGPAELVAAVRRLGLDAVVLDSYTLDPGTGVALRAAGVPVLALIDGEPRGAVADVYVDQNLDAELATPALPPGAVRLAGLRYCLLGSAVRRLRPERPRPAGERAVPRVLCFFGGTDAFGAAPTVARLLLGTGAPLDATVVGATERIRGQLRELAPGAGQRLTVIEPTDELAPLMAAADLVVAASGTSAWELLCLGAPAALVWVVDNQRLGYDRLVRRELVAGLGRLADLAADPAGLPAPAGEEAEASRPAAGDAAEASGPAAGEEAEASRPAAGDAAGAAGRATEQLRLLLTDPDRRTRLGARAWAAVDGRGVRRVADELLARAAAPDRTGRPDRGPGGDRATEDRADRLVR